jgi:acyl transferase domain-containing protein
MLEGTYEAFENAGLTMDDVIGSNTSVYAGSFFKDYHDAGLRDVTTLPRFFLVGVGSAMASNRLSHYFDLRGASMSIDTGCSTTLTALHQACNDLRNHESSMSVVSGANLMLNPDMFITMSSIALISKDGRSFAFDSRANGYGRGEGAATIVLKRLDDAIRDGDPIQCVIKETGLNQDGKTETITTPSQAAQIELMRRVYKKGGLDPKDTGYFEVYTLDDRLIFTPTLTSPRPMVPEHQLEILWRSAQLLQYSRIRDQPRRRCLLDRLSQMLDTRNVHLVSPVLSRSSKPLKRD